MHQLPRLLQRLLHVASDLVEECPCRGGIVVHQLASDLQADRKGNQALLRTVVQLALDPAAVGLLTRLR